MHNKFFIIDSILVGTGSVNWTRTGLNGNYENCVVFRDKNVVQQFIKHFNQILETAICEVKSSKNECTFVPNDLQKQNVTTGKMILKRKSI
jgi:phosphatidylserine/phosphatidylglycerophosphate/cardiolipin synthase-like enzyme